MNTTPTHRDPHAALKEQQMARRTRATFLFIAGGAFGAFVGFYSLLAVEDIELFVVGILAAAIIGGWLSSWLDRQFREWLACVGPWIWP